MQSMRAFTSSEISDKVTKAKYIHKVIITIMFTSMQPVPSSICVVSLSVIDCAIKVLFI